MTHSSEVPGWIGQTVFDVSGERIGKVSDVYRRSGTTNAFILSVETETGVNIALSASRLEKLEKELKGLSLPYSHSQLADAPTSAPGFKPTKKDFESVEEYFASLDLPGDPEVPYKGGDQKSSNEEEGTKRKKKK